MNPADALHTTLTAFEVFGFLAALWMVVCVPVYVVCAVVLYRRRARVRSLVSAAWRMLSEDGGRV